MRKLRDADPTGAGGAAFVAFLPEMPKAVSAEVKPARIPLRRLWCTGTHSGCVRIDNTAHGPHVFGDNQI
jgi:hypothetical protein